MNLLVICTSVLFAWAVLASAAALYLVFAGRVVEESHAKELAGVNKVGKWYENRVQELEEETQLLAAQIVAAGSAPIRQVMPRSDPDSYAEYAFDPTGLVVEKLDARDLPVS